MPEVVSLGLQDHPVGSVFGPLQAVFCRHLVKVQQCVNDLILPITLLIELTARTLVHAVQKRFEPPFFSCSDLQFHSRSSKGPRLALTRDLQTLEWTPHTVPSLRNAVGEQYFPPSDQHWNDHSCPAGQSHSVIPQVFSYSCQWSRVFSLTSIC